MFKKISVNSISVLLTAGIVFSHLFINLAQSYLNRDENTLWEWIFYVLSIAVIFMLTRLVLTKLIFPRLRLMFKIINDSSLKTREVSFDKDTDLASINRDVMAWAADRRNELEDMKKLEEYRKNYLGNVSHELKTPLFSVIGYLHTLLDGGLEDKSINKRYIQKAADNAERLQFIVNDLDKISQLEDGAPIEKNEFNLRRLIEGVIGDLELLSKERDVKLSIGKAPNTGLWVEAEESSIRQVIENLLTNSIRYGKEGGKTKIHLKENGDDLTIQISDNGVGIEQKHLKHLFDRFYRVDDSRSRHLGGSGLGLAIVKHILEAHDQTISVKSEPGKGSTFSFSLPKMKYSVGED